MNDISGFTDEEIIDIVRSKSKEAYAEIIKRYQKKLLRYASYLMSDEHAAADAVQDGFIKAYINLNSFDTKRKFSSWMYRIIHNQAMSALPKRSSQSAFEEETEFDSGLNLENEMVKKEMMDMVHDCLGSMPVLYRAPLSLHFIEEKTYEEISDILRIPIGTVGTRINRAKGIMKKVCQKKQ